MENNDILRRIRYTLDIDDPALMAIFGLAEFPATRAMVCDWLKKKDDPAFQELSDTDLARFLNGLIIHRRGRKPGPLPKAETRLTNNMVFMKLKIALDLKADDVLETMARVNLPISRHELSAFFRRPDHKHYRECNDQILRNFLTGIQQKYRPGPDAASEVSTDPEADRKSRALNRE